MDCEVEEVQCQMCSAQGLGTSIKEKTFLKHIAPKRRMYVVIVRSLLLGNLAINFRGNFVHDNYSHISHTYYLLCIDWKSNYSVLENCFIYLQGGNCMINPRR